MKKIIPTFGALVVIVVVALALLTPPSAAPSQASEETAAVVCRTVETPLDEGYGVTSMVKHEVCAPETR